jgi:hypothetical protein
VVSLERPWLRRAGLATAVIVSLAACGSSGDPAGAPAATTVARDAATANEFSNDAAASGWRDIAAGRHTTLDLGRSRPGWLTIVPAPRDMNAWFSDNEGPYYYRVVTGDFVAETSVVLGTATNRRSTPTRPAAFSGAGFVVRDPASARGRQQWVMYDIGFQDSAVALEIKTTTPGSGNTSSLSTLYLNNTPGAANAARLRVCRLGPVFRFFHRFVGETGWTEERYRTSGPAPTRVNGNGPRPAMPDGTPLRFDRPDIAGTTQVGVMVGVWAPDPAGTRGEFDYVRIAPAGRAADCTAELGV